MIRAEKAHFPVSMMCEVFEVSQSGFYAFERRPPSQTAKKEKQLLHQIHLIHILNHRAYGSPRIHEELRARGFETSRYRVAKIMRRNGIRAQRKRPFRVTTTTDDLLPIFPNLLDRNFDVHAPDQAWVSDICYVHTLQGWMYLCIVLDLYSRRIVGWAMQPSLDASLALRALRMALLRRQPSPGLLFHSDRGCQYASEAFRKELAEAQAIQSMSRTGDCYDNAVAESFFSSLRAELTDHYHWRTRRAAKAAVRNYIEAFYNLRRRHSYLGYLSPVDFENLNPKVNYAIA